MTDSAITSEGPDLPEHGPTQSSFGEAYVNEPERKVHSLGFKVVELTSKIFVAYAGDVKSAKIFLQDLKQRMRYLNSDNLDLINNLLDEYYRPSNFSLIFTLQGDSEAHLYSYNITNSRELSIVNDDIVISGNSSKYFNDLVSSWLRHIVSSTQFGNPSHYLTIFCTYLQMISSRQGTLQHGYGGAYSGVVMNSTKVLWLKDITYVLYNDDLRNKSEHSNLVLTKVYIRNGLGLELSMKSGNPKTFTLRDNFLNLESSGHVELFEEDYVCFINVLSGLMIIITKDFNKLYRYFTLVDSSNERTEYSLHDELVKYMYTPCDDDILMFFHLKGEVKVPTNGLM